jgi:predicted type IV restriction endonuclease
MTEKWNYFVYDLCEAKTKDIEEDGFHALIETQLQHLGWAKYKEEICHKPSIHLGNNNSIVPDIIIKRDGEDEFVIEVKRPSHKQSKKDVDQLLSYMRILKLNVGIYIGDHIEIFYDMPSSKEAISVMKVPLEINNKLGAKFVERFDKENFSQESIVDFCEERIQEIQRQNSLNEIKQSLIADAQTQIAESLRPYLIEKYAGSFSEEEIKNMLATMRFTASADGNQPESKVVAPKSLPKPKSNLIKCVLTRNANARAIFNPQDQSLTVLKGSTVNPVHVPKFSDSDRKKRDRQLAEYTEVKDGQRIVKEDVCFDTPSGAALFCVGGSANGWKEWKDAEGRELKVYRANNGTPKKEGRFDANRVTDPREFQLDFWTKFKAKLEATGKIPTLQTPQPHNWYDVRIGRSNILLNNVCNTQKNFVGVKLYIRKPAVDKFYPALEARREEINHALGCEPKWDANPSAKDKTIALFHQTDLTDPHKEEEALDWLVAQTIIFYNVFSKEVKGIN